jgi:hypothetical protein
MCITKDDVKERRFHAGIQKGAELSLFSNYLSTLGKGNEKRSPLS